MSKQVIAGNGKKLRGGGKIPSSFSISMRTGYWIYIITE